MLYDDIQRWLGETSQVYAPATLVQYRLALSPLGKRLGPIATNNVLPRHVVEYLEALRLAGCCNTTRALKHAAMLSFFRWAQAQGLCLRNPAQAIKAPKAQRKPQPIADLSAMERLISAAKGQRVAFYAVRDTALVMMLAATGLRRNELLSLSVDDVAFVSPTDGQALAARVTVLKAKGGKGRIVGLDQRTSAALAQWLAVRERERPKTTALWLALNGESLGKQGLTERIRTLSGLAGMAPPAPTVPGKRRSWTPHTLRRGWAGEVSRQMREGAAIFEGDIDAAGGWTTPQMRARYEGDLAMQRQVPEAMARVSPMRLLGTQEAGYGVVN